MSAHVRSKSKTHRKSNHRNNHHDQPPAAGKEAIKSNGKSETEDRIADTIKELVKLAKEQGYLTYGDLNDTLPDTITSP